MPPKLFCGNIREPPQTLPDGYDGYDTQYNCLRKGVGIGLYLSRNRNNRLITPVSATTNTRLPWWVILIIVILVLILILTIVLIIWMIIHK